MHCKHRSNLFVLVLALLLCLQLPLAAQHKLTEDEAREKYGLHATMNDTWAIAAWEWTRDIVLTAYDWTREQVTKMLFDDMDVESADEVGMGIPALLTLLMLFSGCWAASIAQMRRHNRLIFFILGFVGVLVVPIALLFVLNIKGEKELLARIADEAAQRKAVAKAKADLEEQQARATGQKFDAVVSDAGVVWDKNYFESIAYKADGSLAGPWDAVYNGGIKAHVLNIIEVQEAFVQVRYVNAYGKEMTGRIPLAKLEEWKDA